MTSLPRLILPMLLGLPMAAAAQSPSETLEVIGTAPKSTRPGRPVLQPRPPEFVLNSRAFHFPSGLRVVMQSDRTHPIVSLLMVVDHGAGDDPEGKNGTAHFVEHTWFRSVHDGLPPIMTLIQDLGTQFNATTRPDTTDYRTVASSEFLPLLLRLESKRLTEPYVGMTEEQVETEREVVRNEWRRRNEQSSSLAFDYLLKSVFPEGHPYHSRETNESLDNIDLQTLQTYFDEHYTPDKASLIVIGDFDIEDSLNLLLTNLDPEVIHPDLTAEHIIRFARPGIENPDPDNLSHWSYTAVNPANPDEPLPLVEGFPARVPRETAPLPPPPSQEVREYKAAVDNRTVLVGWALPGGFRGNDTDMTILANTASAIVASTLAQRGMLDNDTRKRGLKDPGCFALPMKLHSVMACAIEVTDTERYPSARRVADMLIDQLPPLWNPEQVQMQQKFFGQGKNTEFARVLRSVDDVAQHFGGRAEDIGFHFHQTGSARFHTDRINEVARLDFARIADLGYEHLRRDRAAVAVVDPIPKKEIDKTAETSSYHGASDADAIADGENKISDLTDETIESSYVKPNLDRLVDKKLRNGMRVVIVPHGDSPLVEATLTIGGGTGMEPKGMFTFMQTFNRDDWSEPDHDPLMIAAGRTGGAGLTDWSTGLRAPAGNLDGALWLLREEMETKDAYMSRRRWWIKRRREALLGQLHSRTWHINDMYSRHLYPDDPSKWPTNWDDIATMDEWRGKTVKAVLADVLQPENATLTIVGNIDADDALRLAVDYFAGWEPRKDANIGPAERPTIGGMEDSSKILIFDNPKRTQTQVTRLCRLNTSGVEDLRAASVLSNLVFDRTFSQLRVKEALAYSPGGFARVGPDGDGSLIFSSLAVNIGVGRTLEFFRDLTEEVESGEVNDAMLTTYKARLARNYGVSAQSTNQLTSRLSTAIAWQQPWSMLTQAGEQIASVDAEQLRAMVDGCNARAITTLEGPAEVIEPQLKEKGFDYEVVDWEARGDEIHEAADPKSYKKYKKAKEKAEAKKEEAGEDEDSDDSEAPDESSDGSEGPDDDEFVAEH